MRTRSRRLPLVSAACPPVHSSEAGRNAYDKPTPCRRVAKRRAEWLWRTRVAGRRSVQRNAAELAACAEAPVDIGSVRLTCGRSKHAQHADMRFEAPLPRGAEIGVDLAIGRPPAAGEIMRRDEEPRRKDAARDTGINFRIGLVLAPV